MAIEMTLALFQVSLVQSLLLIEGLSGLLLIPLWVHGCSNPDCLTSECDSEDSLAKTKTIDLNGGRLEAENVTSRRVWQRADVFEFFIQLHCQSLTSYCQHF